MDYEKAYKEALERASKLRMQKPFDTVSQMMEHVFPELKESEDDKIKKSLIILLQHFCKGYRVPGLEFPVSYKDMLNWLEKQGERKSVDDLTQQEAMDIAVAKCFEQGEKNPVDKVEPKFQNGQWIVWQDKSYEVKRNDCGYELIDTNGLSTSFENGTVDENAHIWTIKNAKDGDVLVSKHNQPFIYNGIFDEDSVGAYCGIDKFGNDFLKDTFSCDWTYKEGVKPATKEQCSLLFEKMREAGYMWDAEKKELNKIENQSEQVPVDKIEPKFKPGDWIVISTTKGDRVVQIASVEYFTKNGYPSYITTEGRWFGNGTKARLLTDKDVEITTIPESKAVVNKIKSWSEEDECYMSECIGAIATKDGWSFEEKRKTKHWLESLKHRLQ